MIIGNVLKILSAWFISTQPLGSYVGSKTVFGETIGAAVNVRDGQIMDFSITGAFVVNCADEAYVMNENEILMTDIGLVGDCAHDALADNGVTLTSIVYDGTNDQITVSVKYSIAKIDMVLSPESNFMAM